MMDQLDICKAVSKAFNSSASFDEFIVQLDLLGIELHDVETKYTASNLELLSYMRQWCANGKVSFEKMFALQDFASIALPYSIAQISDSSMHKTTLQLNAIASNGKDIWVAGRTDNGEILYGIDFYSELLSSLVHELSVLCKKEARHGKV